MTLFKRPTTGDILRNKQTRKVHVVRAGGWSEATFATWKDNYELVEVIAVKQPKRGFVNIFLSGHTLAAGTRVYRSRREADEGAANVSGMGQRIACVNWTEGQYDGSVQHSSRHQRLVR